jgi:hypothetical protein
MALGIASITQWPLLMSFYSLLSSFVSFLPNKINEEKHDKKMSDISAIFGQSCMDMCVGGDADTCSENYRLG